MPTEGVQPTDLNQDATALTPTTGYFADDGSGDAKWHHWQAVDDGADVAKGATDDAEVLSGTGTISGKLRGVLTRLASILTQLGTGATALLKAEDAAHASGDTGVMALAVRRDTAAASSGTTGDYEPLQTDATGRLRVADSATSRIGALLNARTTALDNILLVKASAGTLFGFQGYTDDDGFIVVIADADGTISNGVQCLEAIPVIDPSGAGAGAPFSLDFGRYGLAVATGICLAFSTTGPTFTDGGNHMFASAQYE